MNIGFITGITGQDGSFLAELLLEKGYYVHGLIRRASTFNTSRIDHLMNNQKLILHYGDLTDSSNLLNILLQIKGKYDDIGVLEVYNLGAMSHVKVSFDMPEYAANCDALGVLRLLEAIRHSGLMNKSKFYQASTSELYGLVQELPQKETTPFYPRSPYAVAKLYGYWITKNYREAYNMFACNGILFNHEGPRRGPTFVTRKITLGLSKILKDPNFVLQLGNLNALRDWCNAKDMVYGMYLMLQQDKADDYVLSSAEYHTVREFCEKAFAHRGFKLKWRNEGVKEEGYDENTGRILIQVNEKYFRPAEVEELLGDYSKAKEKLGWFPKTSFDELVKNMVDNDCT